jgi:hypothetical protein
MAVTLNLSKEIERRLRELAAKAGLALEAYLQSLAEREAAMSNGPTRIPAQLQPGQWSTEWRAWANTDRQLPVGFAIDDSRESIYAGQGE